MNDFDLQIQSSASDGKYAPRELVKRAADLKLKTIAITDHDTVSGVPEAISAGEDYGVEVIPAIELSSNENNASMHILGFGLDYKNPALLGALAEAQRERIERAKEIIARLQKIGLQITYEDVLCFAKGTSVGRPHIALAILANPENKKTLGAINNVEGVIKTYLVAGKPTYVEHVNISVKEAVDLIHIAGGIAAWSHPAINEIRPEKLEVLLQKFIGYGLDGIEVFNPAHTEGQVKFLQELFLKYPVLRTGGSDFHTDVAANIRPDGGLELASFPTYGLDVSDIVLKLKEAIARRRKEI